ncbi:hypothetical protein VAJ37_25105 [Klebsiella pneumoniae]|nr:hypothetical protein [Klebsiella pneumoniae]MEE2326253.1 hypothetical protein [Klebsiella pneumoniae]
MENQEHLTLIHSLIKTHAFNGYTLVSTKYWQTPSVSDISVVRGLIPLTDLELAHRLAVDPRTIRKWKSGQTQMVFTTWCCLCWLAGLGWACRWITKSATEDATVDTAENIPAVISPAACPDIGKLVKVG